MGFQVQQMLRTSLKGFYNIITPEKYGNEYVSTIMVFLGQTKA